MKKMSIETLFLEWNNLSTENILTTNECGFWKINCGIFRSRKSVKMFFTAENKWVKVLIKDNIQYSSLFVILFYTFTCPRVCACFCINRPLIYLKHYFCLKRRIFILNNNLLHSDSSHLWVSLSVILVLLFVCVSISLQIIICYCLSVCLLVC